MNDLEINRKLIEYHGKHDNGNARFRVVWSTGLTEKRNGTFNERTEGGIFLREVVGVVTVPKYPFDKDRWVLEMYVQLEPDSQVAKELVENNWSYEPLWVFKGDNGEFRPLQWDMVKAVVHSWFNRDTTKKTPTQRITEHEAREERGKERDRQLLGEDMSVPHLMDLVE